MSSLKILKHKGLTKNYIQSKYMQLQDGTQEQRTGWRRYLIDDFKKQIEDFMYLNRKRTNKKHAMTKSNFHIPLSIQFKDDFFAVNEIIRKSNPSLNIQEVQQNIIHQNEYLLLKNTSVDYDEKLKQVVKQFEIMVDRIEKETFKMKLPNNFHTAMSNYNDYYNIKIDDKLHSPRVFGTTSLLSIDRKLKKKEDLYNLFDESNIDKEMEAQQRFIEQLEIKQPYIAQINEDFVEDLPTVEDQIQDQIQDQIIEEKCSSKRPKSRVPTLRTEYSQRSNQSNRQMRSNIPQTYLEYFLALDNIFDANLEPYIKPQEIHNYDSYEFMDETEEQAEFQQLLDDQKRNQILKPQIQQVIDELKKQKQQLSLPTQVILKILVRLPENKTNNTSGIALNIIAKIFNMNQLKEEDYHHILHSLYQFKDEQQSQNQLKLVQCCLQLLTDQFVTIQSPEVYDKLIQIFITLSQSKNPIIQTSIMTGLDQLLEIIYNQYLKNQNKNGVILFQQLFNQIQKGIYRDMVFQILQKLGLFVQKDEQINKIVDDKLSLMLYEEIILDSNDVKFNARRIRDSFRMIEYMQKEISLIKHLSILYQKQPPNSYIKYWILEGFQSLLQQPQLVILLSKQPEDQQSYLQIILQLIQQNEYDDKEKQMQQHKNSKLSELCILSLNDQPYYTKSQFYQKESECICTYSDTLQQIAYTLQIQAYSKNYQVVQNNKILNDDNHKEFILILEQSNLQNLKCIQKILEHIQDEKNQHLLLNVLQNWISLLGCLGCQKQRDIYIKYLSGLCISKNQILSNFQMQCSKVLFNIAQLGSILDVKSWHLIMKSMQQFEIQLNRTLQGLQHDNQSEQIQQEINILQNILDQLFLSSSNYDEQHLLNIIDALNQVTLGLMEQYTPSIQLIEAKQIQFGLIRLTQIIKVNWQRIDIFWEFITAQFTCIFNCKQKTFREIGLETFTQLITQGFQYFLNHHNEKWGNQWQTNLLNPFQQMIKIKYADVKETLLNILFKSIQNNGHELQKDGFNSIIVILNTCCDETEPSNYVNVGFHILELIIGQFLNILDPNSSRTILPLIKQFRQKTTEQNISYVSVGLIWQLADNFKVIGQNMEQNELEELWTTVFSSLKDLCIDWAPDVRQAALHIIIQIIVINCTTFKVSFQLEILRTVLFKILDELIGRVAQLNQLQVIFHMKWPKYIHQDQQPQFQKFQSEEQLKSVDNKTSWEDTLRLMIQNLSKVLKKISQQENDEFKQHAEDIYNEIFIRILTAFKLNHLDLKGDIVKLIKENLEIIVEKKQLNGLEWSKDLLQSTEEFLCQKLQDQRDAKTLVNKILPDICEIYTLLVRSNSVHQLYPEFLDELFDSYQIIIDYPVQLENLQNIKVWMDEKQLYDYIEDFEQLIKYDFRIYKLLLFNIQKEGISLKLQDQITIRYIQLFQKYIIEQKKSQGLSQQYEELLEQYIMCLIKKIELRNNLQILNQVKGYSKLNKTLWVQILPNLLETIEFFELRQFIPQIGDQLHHTISWDKLQVIDAIRSIIDVDVQVIEWLVKNKGSDMQIISYWTLLNKNLNLYQYEDLLYETRQRLVQVIIKQNGIIVLQQITKQLFQQFMRDEYMSGSMPLSRKRVQEIIFLLIELQQLKDVNISPHPLIELFESLVELITTKEIDLKLPLQSLFKEVGIIIKKQ
ncbi:hypothetical protein pb186bvf_010297 [Paramecium bursaria]